MEGGAQRRGGPGQGAAPGRTEAGLLDVYLQTAKLESRRDLHADDSPRGGSREEFRIVAVTEKAVLKALRAVKDPELNLDLVVLGLIYEVEVDGTSVNVKLSLTTPMCPAAAQILDEAKAAVEGVEGVRKATVELTFDPPWTPERISPLIRSSLGIQ